MTKITLRQIYVMYILMTLSPAIRLFPAFCARYGGAAGWLAPVFGAVVPLIIVFVLSAIYKNRTPESLGAVYRNVFGTVLSKAVLTVYLIWSIILFLLYIRYYSELLVSSLFTQTAPDFFIIVMLAAVFFAARTRLTALARFSEISILVFAVVLAVFFASLLPTLRLINVMPVTYHDTVPVLQSLYPFAGVWGYVTPLFFLGGHFALESGSGEIKRRGVKTALLLGGASALMIFTVVGSLGPDAAARMPLPFLKVSKLIDIMQSFDRFEAVLTSLWVIADFILIAVLVFVITHIAKDLFGLTQPRYLTGPVILIGYAGSLLLSADRHGLESLSASPAGHLFSLALCLFVPVMALAVGRLRKRL